MRIKDVSSGAEFNLWLRDNCAAKLKLDKNQVPYYDFLCPTPSPEFKALVGTVVTNDTVGLSITANVQPMGQYYVALPKSVAGVVTIPYHAIKNMRVLGPRAEYPPLTRYNSNRTLIDGLTYRKSELVILAW